MAETVNNGVVSTEGADQKTSATAAEKLNDADQNSIVTELTRKSESLEKENKEMKEKIRSLTIEVEAVEEDKNLFESLASRAVDLETEVSRLQHDLVTAVTEAEEANAEVVQLKKAIGEKGEKIESLEKDVDGLKKEKTDSEKKVRELERKIGLLEVREMEEKSKRVRVEDVIKEKEKKIGELETELEKFKLEKKTVELALKESEKQSKEVASKTLQLQKDIEEAQRAFHLTDSDVELSTAAGKGFNWKLPLVAVAASAATATVFVCYAKRSK